jgi:hypothetical protein
MRAAKNQGSSLMRNAAVWCRIEAMRRPQRTTLTLELEDVEPIKGRMRAEHGPSREFVGWLGLAAALESVLAPLPGDRGAIESASRAGSASGER